MKHVAPDTCKRTFSCFHCGAITQHDWWGVDWNGKRFDVTNSQLQVSTCIICDGHSLWQGDSLIFPRNGEAPAPNPDMPDSIRDTYSEAAAIHSQSPRAAAALLRLAIQNLCIELGEKGENINADIKSLVAKGLPEIVQRSLDVVRVVGNNAVHPGQINTDDHAVTGSLFELINVIVEYMISLPKRVGILYGGLPQGSLDAIEKRDKKAVKTCHENPYRLSCIDDLL